MSEQEKPRTWMDIAMNVVANMGEEAFNDLLTEPWHPLSGVWHALDTDLRAKCRQQWRDRIKREFGLMMEKSQQVFEAQFPEPVEDDIIAEIECPKCTAPLTIYEDEDGKQRVLTGPTAEARTAWQPIETAPMTLDYIYILTHGPRGHVVTRYCSALGWVDEDDRDVYFTHWQPLPAPPASEVPRG